MEDEPRTIEAKVIDVFREGKIENGRYYFRIDGMSYEVTDEVRGIARWHQQELVKARINEGQMFREAIINHSTPAIYWGKRLDELSLNENKDK